MHKQLFNEAQENFTITDDQVTNQGKVTFKVKPEGSQPPVKKSKKEENNEEQDDPNKAGRMLKTEEIREICDKHQLSRMEVYNIRS